MAGLRFSSTHLCLLGNRFVLFLVLLNLLYQRRTDTQKNTQKFKRMLIQTFVEGEKQPLQAPDSKENIKMLLEFTIIMPYICACEFHMHQYWKNWQKGSHVLRRSQLSFSHAPSRKSSLFFKLYLLIQGGFSESDTLFSRFHSSTVPRSHLEGAQYRCVVCCLSINTSLEVSDHLSHSFCLS